MLAFSPRRGFPLLKTVHRTVFNSPFCRALLRLFAPEARGKGVSRLRARPGALPHGPRSLERLANFLVRLRRLTLFFLLIPKLLQEEKIMDTPLKKLREEVKMSPQTMADYIGYSLEDYLKIENGEVYPSVPVLKKLSFYYDTSIDYLLGVTALDRPYRRIYQKEDTLKNGRCD